MLVLKKTKLVLIGLSIMLLAGTGCSVVSPLVSPLMGPSKAEIAQQEKQEKILADKAAAEAKEKAQKKAAAEEDAVQVQKPDVVDVVKAEKLPEEASSQDAASRSSEGGAPIALTSGEVSAVAAVKSKHKIPTEPNTYLVTVEPKNKTHPYFNQGDNRGFALNGHQGMHIVAKRGSEVTFQVRTGVKHDFYLTTAPKGWGATPFVDGVEGHFTYKGDVSFKPSKETPNDLYYGCRNHNSMGGRIVVVDANADIVAVMQKLDAERDVAQKNAKTVVNKDVKPQKVSQKIAYVGMMLRFKGKGLPAAQQDAIKAKLENAKQLQKKGELAAALAMATEAGALIKSNNKKAGPTKEELASLKEELNDHMITLEAFVDAHKASSDQAFKQGAKVVDYDHDLVKKMITEANELSIKNQYGPAKNRIKRAERVVTKALNDMLNSTTIVYDLNFETPADEYAYEVKKYEGYLELVPVAIEVKKPNPASIKFSETYIKKGAFFKDKADESAKADRWGEAMVVIRDATLEVRRGLRILGVSM